MGMYFALLIVHCLILRAFIEGMIRRDFDFNGGEKSSDPKIGTNCNYEAGECDGVMWDYIKEWLRYTIVGVAIIVVAVPEGLPLAVMISLAYSVSKMLKDQNFVKRLSSCEIMGGANNICSDKTGTLTKNEMTWVAIWAGADKRIENAGGTEPLKCSDFVASDKTMDMIRQTVSCNTSGSIDEAQATEKAMLKFIQRCQCNFEDVRKQLVPDSPIRFQFSSARKRMSTVVEVSPDETEHSYGRRLHVKGASEIVLATCSHYLNEAGEKVPLDDNVLSLIKDKIEEYARGALRTIAFAYKDLQEGEGGDKHDEIEEGSKIYKIEEADLTLICLAGIADIIRPEVPLAVEQCNEAGVRVRMVTGDNKITAIAIAKECGIIDNKGEEKENCICMEGPEFAEFVGGLVNKDTGEPIAIYGKEPEKETIGNKENMKLIRQKLKVLARSRPNDKYIMVAGLKELGDIVAVTGDGTNDAPALKKADVGFAMRTGTQVAHTASDIIIQDDNFASIVKACKWGRNVYDNIRRFLQFQLTVNVVALITSFIGSVIMLDSPLQAIQLLWVNLIMDSLASLALATEEPKEELLKRPPYRKKEYIINAKMTKHIGGMSIFQAIILFFFVFGAPNFIREDAPWGVDGKGWDEDFAKLHPNPEMREWNHDYVINGMVRDLNGKDVYKHFEGMTPSRHLTVVFNLFVFL